MKEYSLRNHIPIGGSATREPCLGDEDDLRVSLGWFSKRLNTNFSGKWHTDPVYRYHSLLDMKKHLGKTFPMVSYFKSNYNNGIEKNCSTISAAYGITVIPQCLVC